MNALAERIEHEQARLEKWYNSNYRKVYRRTCPICGRPFFSRMITQKYCPFALGKCKEIADAQNKKARRASKTNQTICAICGNTFYSKRKDAKYCSNACRQKAYRDKALQINNRSSVASDI